MVIREGGSASAVALRQEGDRIVLDNGVVSMAINPSDGSIRRLTNAQGIDVLGPDGYSYMNGFFSNAGERSIRWSFRGADYRVVADSSDRVEICFSAEATDHIPFTVSLHYCMHRGDSGFYWYLTLEHPESAPPAGIGFLRRVMRFSSDLFTHAALSDGRITRLPSPEEQALGETIMDATIRLPDGTVYTKYDFADYLADHRFHGAMGESVGLWSISASNEYRNGGPTKQYNTVHAGGSTHVMLDVLQSVHFIGGTSIRAEGEWAKVFGPVFVYLNSGDGFDSMWADVKRRAEEEAAKWPYQWVDSPHYPTERGSVVGQLCIEDAALPDGAWVILAAPDQDWQKQSNGYIFWARTGADGRFEVRSVRPGRYTLYAYAPGALGEFRLDGVEVNAREATNLGSLQWVQERHGEMLWEIGIPDRCAGEFRRGDEYRRWGLWALYPKDFPQGVRYVVGESDWRRDWNYLQPVKLYAEDGNTPVGDADPWEVVFGLDKAPRGQAFLTVAVAGSSEVTLAVEVNGVPVAELHQSNDSSIHRGGNRGLFRQSTIEFDAALLHEGSNTVRLTVSGSSSYAGIMYDYLRLEVACEKPGFGHSPSRAALAGC